MSAEMINERILRHALCDETCSIPNNNNMSYANCWIGKNVEIWELGKSNFTFSPIQQSSGAECRCACGSFEHSYRRECVGDWKGLSILRRLSHRLFGSITRVFDDILCTSSHFPVSYFALAKIRGYNKHRTPLPPSSNVYTITQRWFDCARGAQLHKQTFPYTRSHTIYAWNSKITPSNCCCAPVQIKNFHCQLPYALFLLLQRRSTAGALLDPHICTVLAYCASISTEPNAVRASNMHAHTYSRHIFNSASELGRWLRLLITLVLCQLHNAFFPCTAHRYTPSAQHAECQQNQLLNKISDDVYIWKLCTPDNTIPSCMPFVRCVYMFIFPLFRYPIAPN